MLQNFSDHKGSIISVLCMVLGQNYSNGIVSVDMDVVGVMAAYLSVVRVCSSQCRETWVPLKIVQYTLQAKYWMELTDDGSLVIRNMLEQF